MESLRQELLQSATLSEMQVASLRRQGVEWHVLLETRAWFTAAVHFKPPLFEFTQEGGTGRTALILPIYDGEDVIDICAVDPRHPGTFATRDGRADILGEDKYSGIMGGALPVFRNPLSWLQGGADGIVLLRPESAWRILRGTPRIIAEDKRHALDLKRLLRPPPWQGEIFHFQYEEPAHDRSGAETNCAA